MDGKECKTNLDLFQLIPQCSSSSSFKTCHDYLAVALTFNQTKVHSKHSIKIIRTRSLLFEKISNTLIQVYADNTVFHSQKRGFVYKILL